MPQSKLPLVVNEGELQQIQRHQEIDENVLPEQINDKDTRKLLRTLIMYLVDEGFDLPEELIEDLEES